MRCDQHLLLLFFLSSSGSDFASVYDGLENVTGHRNQKFDVFLAPQLRPSGPESCAANFMHLASQANTFSARAIWFVLADCVSFPASRLCTGFACIFGNSFLFVWGRMGHWPAYVKVRSQSYAVILYERARNACSPDTHQCQIKWRACNALKQITSRLFSV